MIDLHLHSTCSDGTDTPEALVALGRRAELHALAIADHDTVAGVAPFLATCRRERIMGFSGIELSVETPSGSMHLLGYGIDPDNRALALHLEQVRKGRESRNRKILLRLNEIGLPLSWEDVLAHSADGAVMGRPHFAQALMACGRATSVQDAFDRFLSKGRPAYVERFRLEPETAIRLIRGAGGLPVVAHPFTWERSFAVLEERMTALRGCGLGGIEAYHPDHDLDQQVACLRLAKKLGLVVTGGSDYHGSIKPRLAIGRAYGNQGISDDLLPPLLAVLPSRAGVVMECSGFSVQGAGVALARGGGDQ